MNVRGDKMTWFEECLKKTDSNIEHYKIALCNVTLDFNTVLFDETTPIKTCFMCPDIAHKVRCPNFNTGDNCANCQCKQNKLELKRWSEVLVCNLKELDFYKDTLDIFVEGWCAKLAKGRMIPEIQLKQMEAKSIETRQRQITRLLQIGGINR